jgi:hypothetical protein
MIDWIDRSQEKQQRRGGEGGRESDPPLFVYGYQEMVET